MDYNKIILAVCVLLNGFIIGIGEALVITWVAFVLGIAGLVVMNLANPDN